MMEQYTLSNGLTILLQHKAGATLHTQITVKVGSINEKEGEKGYSHLLEHVMFEGTQKRKNAKVISEEIENLGGELNAATSNEQTYYYIKVQNKDYATALDVLSDMIQNSTLAEDKIKKEQSIVLEEIKMINDQPRYYQWIAFEKTLLKGSLYENPVYGFVKDVKKATRESLKSYYDRFYVPNNAILTIVGDLSDDTKVNIKEQIESCFGQWKQKPVEKQEAKEIVAKERCSEEKKDIQQTYLLQGIITPSILHKDSAVFEVIEAILGKPQSGRANHEMRNIRGLAYDVGVTYENFQTFGFLAINVGFDSKNSKEVRKILKELWTVSQVSEEELSQAKSYILGRYTLDCDDASKLADMITFWQQATRKDFKEEFFKRIKDVSVSDIKRVAEKYAIISEASIVPKSI